jgi:diguanylate cyclase
MEKPFALIVEDDPKAGALFRHALSIAGFEAETIFHSRFAMERLIRCQPWLMILDLDMPGTDGNQLLEAIRIHEKFRHIKVIAVTSYSQVAESLSVEPDLLLFKPVSVEQISDLIARLQLKLKYQTTIPILGEPWDRVTGLYNQSFFEERLDHVLMDARSSGQYEFAVVKVSIDQNNRVKDQLDIRNWIAVLHKAGETLKFAARPTDIVARFEQDNFYILIVNMQSKEVPVMMASRIHQQLRERLSALNHGLEFSILIGIGLGDPRHKSIHDVLREADATRMVHSSQQYRVSQMMLETL